MMKEMHSDDDSEKTKIPIGEPTNLVEALEKEIEESILDEGKTVDTPLVTEYLQ